MNRLAGLVSDVFRIRISGLGRRMDRNCLMCSTKESNQVRENGLVCPRRRNFLIKKNDLAC